MIRYIDSSRFGKRADIPDHFVLILKIGEVGFPGPIIPFTGKNATPPGLFETLADTSYTREQIDEGEGRRACRPLAFTQNFPEHRHNEWRTLRLLTLPPTDGFGAYSETGSQLPLRKTLTNSG